MYLNKIIVLICCLASTVALRAQDLIRKVPQDAKVVVSLNSKAVFDHLNMDDLNDVLKRLGLFDKVNKEGKIKVEKLNDLGIDFNAKAYLYVKGTDSIQYFGGLIPLANKSQFESIIPSHKKIHQVDGLSTIYSADKTLRVSWDQNTIYILGGYTMDHYFNKPEVRERYGLLSSSYDDAYATAEAYDYDVVAADTAAAAAYGDYLGEADTIVVDTTSADEIYPPMVMENDEYAVVDSVLAQEQYSDDYHTRYDSIYRHNDSLKNILAQEWINGEMNALLTGKAGSFDAKKLPKLGANTLAHIHATDIMSYYANFYPEDIFRTAFGIKPNFNFGIEGMDAYLVVDKNKLKLTGTATMDKEMSTYYKEIYKKKPNPKFFPYLEENALGFFSFNMNTEAYIKYFPKILERYYGAMVPRYEHVISLTATMMDIMLDEKAIAKVFKGDNLFVLNGVTKMQVEYTDYEYDDDYNYHEVKKTRTETIPQFLWMFSSDDTRIFEKLAQIGIQENGLEDHEGIFEIKDRSSSPIKFFFLIKNGIVFVGNDLSKLKAIQSNSLKTKGHAPYIAMAKKNSMSLLFNTKRIPALLDDLDMPVDRSMKETIDEMSQYGDFYMISAGIKGNKLSGEIGVEFPNKKGNALAFLFDVFNRWTLKMNN